MAADTTGGPTPEWDMPPLETSSDWAGPGPTFVHVEKFLGNRWEHFTDDEVKQIRAALDRAYHEACESAVGSFVDPLREEAEAEVERRRSESTERQEP